MTIDLSTLWDFNHPELSEERFRAALFTAMGDDVFILQTQIARTYGLRGDFSRAQQILAAIQPQLLSVGGEARVRYSLELGRTYSSAAHPPETQTEEVRRLARTAFMEAADLAGIEKLDSLAIDAMHMMAFVDTDPRDQVEWNRKAIALMQASTQADTTKWAGSLHNNLGYALHQSGRYEEALAEFQLALETHQLGGDPQAIRIAYWMVAWTLRALGQLNEALQIQLRLEKECDQAGEPDPYVFDELRILYQALGDAEKSQHYAARIAAHREGAG